MLSRSSIPRKAAIGLPLAAVGGVLALGLLWIVDRFVVGTFLAKDEGLVLPPRSRVAYETDEFRFTAEINQLGFRDHDFTVKRVPGIHRVLAIGDSFTYGWGVQLERSWPKRLEEKIRRARLPVEIANLGKVAAGPVQYAEIASRAVPELLPDVVIVAWHRETTSSSLMAGSADLRANRTERGRASSSARRRTSSLI